MEEQQGKKGSREDMVEEGDRLADDLDDDRKQIEEAAELPKPGPVVPEQLGLDSKLRFACHPGVRCFTACCSDIDIMLTPYDVLRLKQRLGISSDELLEQYTRSRIDEKTGWPQLLLLMGEDEKRSCPFVTEEGCTIYGDRPAMCRYYPVGQGIHRLEIEGNVQNKEFYMLIREDHCLGFKEDRDWTIAEWRENQEAAHYDEMNREWKEIFIQKVSKEEEEDGRKQQLFFIASYNLDQFRNFVFESRLLDLFVLDDEFIARMREDEVELMKFAFRYLRYMFGVEKSLETREGI